MKNLTIYPMSSYKTKLGGLAGTAIALILLLAVKFYGKLPIIPKFDAERQFRLFLVCSVYGLFIIAFSKEKQEDERVQRIRGKSFQSAFMILAGSLIVLSLTSVMTNEILSYSSIELCMLAAFGVTVYLVFFHIGLYFDPAWTYNDDTVLVNIRKNKTFFIIYFAAIIAIFAILLLTRKS